MGGWVDQSLYFQTYPSAEVWEVWKLRQSIEVHSTVAIKQPMPALQGFSLFLLVHLDLSE